MTSSVGLSSDDSSTGKRELSQLNNDDILPLIRTNYSASFFAELFSPKSRAFPSPFAAAFDPCPILPFFAVECIGSRGESSPGERSSSAS